MRPFLLVFLGGGLGAGLRYGAALLVAGRGTGLGPEAAAFPWATLAVNLVGSFLIGVLAGLLAGRETARLVLVTGLLGGFTTFSAFSLDTLTLLGSGRAGFALGYVAASVVGGLALAWLGAQTTR